MLLEDFIPSLRAGRRARRKAWPPGDYIEVPLIGGIRATHFNLRSGPSESTWPGSQMNSHDMLCDDWELLAKQEYEAHVPGHFRDAFNIVFSLMTSEVFDAYSDIRKIRSIGQSGKKVLDSDCDWRTMGKAVLDAYMTAAAAKDFGERKIALTRACISSLKALSYVLAEEYMNQVMTL